jgi:hypothetical protein
MAGGNGDARDERMCAKFMKFTELSPLMWYGCHGLFSRGLTTAAGTARERLDFQRSLRLSTVR